MAALHTAKHAARDGSWVFPLFLWRWLAILDLAARNIDNELGSLAKIAGAFWVLGHHLGKPY